VARSHDYWAACCFFFSAGSSIITVMSAAMWCVGPSVGWLAWTMVRPKARDDRHVDGTAGAIRFLRFSAASMNGASSACFLASRAAGQPSAPHDLGGEQLQRLADMLVLVAAALLDEHDLIDAGLLVCRRCSVSSAGVPMPLPWPTPAAVLGRLKALPDVR